MFLRYLWESRKAIWDVSSDLPVIWNRTSNRFGVQWAVPCAKNMKISPFFFAIVAAAERSPTMTRALSKKIEILRESNLTSCSWRIMKLMEHIMRVVRQCVHIKNVMMDAGRNKPFVLQILRKSGSANVTVRRKPFTSESWYFYAWCCLYNSKVRSTSLHYRKSEAISSQHERMG